MYNRVVAAVVFTQLVDLRMTVVASCDAVICPGGLDLIVLQLPIGQAFLLVSGLEESTATATAVVVGSIRLHVDEILLSNDRPDNKSQIFSHGITIAFTDDLARVLDREFNLQVFVPIGIDLEFSLSDPFGIIFIDVFNLKIMIYIEFF